jgi:hypothetical protein
LRSKKHPQAEGLPHHSANRRIPRHEAGLQPAIDLSPFSPRRCPGLVCRRPLASIKNHQSSIRKRHFFPPTSDP